MNQKQFYLIAMAFLTSILSGLSQQLQSDLTSGTTRFEPHVLFVKKEIAGGGKIDLINSQTKNLQGVCSFDETGKMDVKRAFVFDRISVNYASSGTSGIPGNLEYNTKAPKELQNADVVITQDGKQLLKMPFRDLHNIQTGQKASDEYTELKSLIGFKDNLAVKIELQFPDGVALPTTTGGGSPTALYHYVFVRFDGLQTVVNS